MCINSYSNGGVIHMKVEQYLYWKRFEEQLIGDIEQSKASLLINVELLMLAQEKLSKLKKPKQMSTREAKRLEKLELKGR